MIKRVGRLKLIMGVMGIKLWGFLFWAKSTNQFVLYLSVQK